MDGFTNISEVLRSGVYALLRKGVVIYVGKSKAMLGRVYTHRNLDGRVKRGQKIPEWMPVKGFQFDEVWVRPCHVDALDALEREMINLYKPRYNESLMQGLRVTAPIAAVIAGVAIILNEPKQKMVRRV